MLSDSDQTKKIQKRNCANDVFYTPLLLAKQHLEYVEKYVEPCDSILDGFFGKGAYYNQFDSVFKKDNIFDYTEIELGLDFLEYNKKVDVIVSNPPYSIMDKILQKSVALKPHTISYLIGQNNLTCKRIEYMNSHGYFLDKLHYTKIYKWFGMSLIVIFTNKVCKNCIDFDRTVWRED